MGFADSVLGTLLPPGIDVVGGLIGGLLSGSQKKKEKKMDFEYWQKMKNEKLREAEKLKPTVPRANIESNLPQFADMISRLLSGRASGIAGGMDTGGTDMGLNFQDILNSFAPKTEQAPQRPNMPYGGGPGMGRRGDGYVDDILTKYRMNPTGNRRGPAMMA